MPSQLQPMAWKNFGKGITDYFVDPPEGYARTLDNLLLSAQGKPYQRPGGLCSNWSVLANAERAGKFFRYKDRVTSVYNFFVFAQRALYWSAIADDETVGTTFAEVLDVSSNKYLPNLAVDTATRYCVWQREGQIYSSQYSLNGYQSAFVGWPYKILPNALGSLKVFPAGLPRVGRAWGSTHWKIVPLSDANTTAHAYVYYSCYKYVWTLSDGTTVISYGPYNQYGNPTFKANPIDGTHAVTIEWSREDGSGLQAAVPIYVASANDHVDVANMTLEIFRTTDGGTTPYWLMSTSPTGAATLSDTVQDATLVGNAATNAQGYWAAGDRSYEPVAYSISPQVSAGDPGGTNPWGSLSVLCNDCGYYTSGYYRVFQSIPGIPDAVPPDFFVEMTDRVMGLSSIDVYPIVGCENSIWRLEGQIDSTGAGSIDKRLVSNAVGVRSHSSMVTVGRRIFFAGVDGFYVTDGWTEPQKISKHLDRLYRSLALSGDPWALQSIVGHYNASDNRIYWSVQSTVASTDNDVILVCDLNQGISETMAFTTWSGGDVASNFYPTAFVNVGRALVTADRRGYFRHHIEGQLDDHVVDTNTAVANWAKIGVGVNLETPVTGFGMSQATKWVSKFFVSCQHRAFGANTTLSLLCSTERDKSGVWKDSAVVGKTGLSASADQLIKFTRRVGPSGFRSNFLGFRVKKSQSVLFKSDTLGTAHVGGGLNTLILDSGSWPAGIYKITSVRLSDDGYSHAYQVLSQSGGTLTVSGSMPAGTGKKWQIYGYATGEYFEFESLAVPFVPYGDTNVLGHVAAEDNLNQ